MKVFSGEDSFESYNSLFNLASQLSLNENLSIKVLNEDEVSLDFFIDKLSSLDIFGDNYIYILKRVLNKKDISNYILENIEYLKNQNILIWQDSSMDKRSSLFKKLKDLDLIEDFEKISDKDLRNWLNKLLTSEKLKLEPDAFEYLIVNSLSNKWLLVNNVNKLKVLDINNFDLNTITKYINLNGSGDIWKFLDYFSNRKKDKAILEMERLLSVEDNSQFLISMINREIKILYKLQVVEKENKDIYNYLKLAPFQLKSFKLKTRNFKLKELEKLIERLFNLDYKIKKGEIEVKLALTLFLLTL